MFSLILEPTNLCNRNCVHCLVDKLEPRESISLDLVRKILEEAKDLGMKRVHLTGGEVALYPDLEELLPMIADYGFRFDLVTNSYRFRERMLPLLTQPKVRKKFDGACFSLDGATASSHDAIRGKGSFKEVMEAATLARLKEIPISLKSIVSNFNKNELTEIALLGATLGAQDLSFISLLPTPRLIKEAIIPSPEELNRKCLWIMESLARSVKVKIIMDVFCLPSVVFYCNAMHNAAVDYQGNLVFCCSLFHVVDEGKAATLGEELITDLREGSLKEGIARQFDLLAKLMGQRLKDADCLSPVTYTPCYWCYKHFGKLNWLKNYPGSPWAAGIVDDGNER